MKDHYLDAEEQQILKDFENSMFQAVSGDLKDCQKELQQITKNTLNKIKKIN